MFFASLGGLGTPKVSRNLHFLTLWGYFLHLWEDSGPQKCLGIDISLHFGGIFYTSGRGFYYFRPEVGVLLERELLLDQK